MTTTTTVRRADDPRPFDHSRFADWPEYVALQKAIDAFARRLDDEGVADRAAFVDAVAEIARGSYAGDYCDCWHEGDARCFAEGTDPMLHPFAVEATSGGIQARYRCPRTGRLSICWWALPEGLPR